MTAIRKNPSIQLLAVGDRAQARAFYVGGLDLELIGESKRGLLVGRRGQLLIGLLIDDVRPTADQRLLVEALATPAGAGAVELPTENCVTAFCTIAATGAEVMRSPGRAPTAPWNAWSAIPGATWFGWSSATRRRTGLSITVIADRD